MQIAQRIESFSGRINEPYYCIITYVGFLLSEKRSALGKENIYFEGEVFMGLVLE
jgi:hypothetical protein